MIKVNDNDPKDDDLEQIAEFYSAIELDQPAQVNDNDPKDEDLEQIAEINSAIELVQPA